jgi:cysteinyl-tRNA synthetase
MPPRFYNTLTHQVEDFRAMQPPEVFMYNCGPTVYDYAHIGNFRAFVFADVLRRFLELSGHRVHQVMNLTDVGHMTEDQLADGGGQDKMQVAIERMKTVKKQGQAAVENPDDPYQVAEYFIAAFVEDAKKLGLKIAHEPDHMPRATRHVAQMQTIIAELIRNGHAYVADDGAVYFSVQTFPQYGALSGNTLDKLRGGAGGRVLQSHQQNKRHPADFLLWKPDAAHVMKWDSPWGAGYPGWHIECSAMAMALLGRKTIDIHTGGEDNIFPHHECEIAQSCGFSGHERFANLWMHTRFLLVDGEKMSKSKGNFFTVRDLLAQGIDPAVLRYELLRSHYRSNMNFTRKGIEDSAGAVRKLREFDARMSKLAGAKASTAGVDITHPVVSKFRAALGDDLNMSGALASVFTWIAEFDEATDDAVEAAAALRAIDSVLEVLRPGPDSGPRNGADEGAAEIAAKCSALDAARAAKDYAQADALRQELIAAGYEVLTTKAGTTARKKLA